MNNMKVEFEALPENEGFARVTVAAFLTPLNPTLEEIEDVKTAVSEAVTNAVIHGYKEQGGTIEISCVLEKDLLKMEITDQKHGPPVFPCGRPERRKCGTGDGADVHDAPGSGTFRYGIFFYGSVYGLPGGGIDRGAGDACDHGKETGKCAVGQ